MSNISNKGRATLNFRELWNRISNMNRKVRFEFRSLFFHWYTRFLGVEKLWFRPFALLTYSGVKKNAERFCFFYLKNEKRGIALIESCSNYFLRILKLYCKYRILQTLPINEFTGILRPKLMGPKLFMDKLSINTKPCWSKSLTITMTILNSVEVLDSGLGQLC